MKFLDNEQREQIGFSFIMDKIQVTTAYGVNEKKNIKPFKPSEILVLQEELDNVETMLKYLKTEEKVFKEVGRIFCKLKDIRNSLIRCERLEILDEVELFEIKYFALLVEELVTILKGVDLNIEKVRLHNLEEVISILDPEGKKVPTFYIYNDYSTKLEGIRKRKKEIEQEIFKESDTEKVKELKEIRLNIVIEEEDEELNIRKELSNRISKYVPIMMNNIKSIGKLDLLMGKAQLALQYNGVKPIIKKEMYIKLNNAFNPEIVEVLNIKDKFFTPVSMELNKGTTIITGANMGGKTVTLKTIVLNLLLAHMGFYVFAQEAQLPILDFIYFISDDMQSISKGLSTFGAEIIKLKEVVESAKRNNGFIALDEFARGTNPKEGYYLVKSLAKYLNNFETTSLISTHYDGVVDENMEHYQVIGLKNVDFKALKHKIDLNKTQSVQIIQQHMDYKLEKVSGQNKVPKDALNISVLLGLDEDIIKIAKDYYR